MCHNASQFALNCDTGERYEEPEKFSDQVLRFLTHA